MKHKRYLVTTEYKENWFYCLLRWLRIRRKGEFEIILDSMHCNKGQILEIGGSGLIKIVYEKK